MRADRPNILLILTDQHNPHIAGFAGDPWIETSALDGLAAQATRFTAAYCQSPLCVPARYALWTGELAHRCRAWDNSAILSAEHVTLPGWLAQHGYVAAAVGKMHFRGSEQMYGWQYRPYGDLVESAVSHHQPDPPDTADGRSFNHTVGRLPFAGPTAIPESLLADEVVTIESLAWLLEFAAAHPDQPWFFCASYYRPHFPLTAPGRYVRKYLDKRMPQPSLPAGYPSALHPHDRFIVDDFNLLRFPDEVHRRAIACYYASVTYVDRCIGRLLSELAEADLLENTCIVYTSDHGDMVGEHGLWWKRTYYDASAGTPLLVRVPQQRSDVAVDVPVEHVDLFPTFCDWAGIPTPAGLDGESLAPLLAGRPEERTKRVARSALLGERPINRFRMVRDARWKYVDFPSARPRLFDLWHDPGETDDLLPHAPADAPLDALRRLVTAGGAWDEIAAAQAADRAQALPFVKIGRGANQYRLADDRVVDADDHLYAPTVGPG
jgi:choline-sulfatase